MDKAEHAARLRAAMATRNADRRVVADAVGVSVRTVTNWSTGATMPNPAAAHGTLAPTANACDWVATPICPLTGSRAMIEYVMP